MQQLSRDQINAVVQDHWQWLVFGDDGDGARANFTGKGLRNAHLNGVNLSKANFTDADLSGASLSGAKLKGANFSGASLVGADLSQADLTDCRFRDADLEAADVTGARAPGADFENCRMPIRQTMTSGVRKPGLRRRRWLYPAIGTAALLLVLAYFFGFLDPNAPMYDALISRFGRAS